MQYAPISRARYVLENRTTYLFPTASSSYLDAGIVCYYNKSILIEFDTGKRDKALAERGLDFARAGEVFAGANVTISDERQDYGEARWITVGRLDERVVVVVWTPRGAARRIISIRNANEREIEKYAPDVE